MEDGGQRTEDRGQRTEDRGLRTEDTGLRTDCMVECSLDVQLMDFLEMVSN